MSEDFYPFVDSGDQAPDNAHLTGEAAVASGENQGTPRGGSTYTTRISVYDDMLSTPRVIVVEQADVRTYLEDVTNTVHRTMKEQGGHLSLMIIRELVENFIHAQFSEPVISILDDGDTIRFADQGPGINDKERAFEFGVTSADRMKKRYIRGTGAGLPMVQQYVEAAGGAISVEDNLGAGTVVTVSVNPTRVAEIEHAVSRGAAVRSGHKEAGMPLPGAETAAYSPQAAPGVAPQPQVGTAGDPWAMGAQGSPAGEMTPAPDPSAGPHPMQGGYPGQGYPWPQAAGGAWPGGPVYGQEVAYGQPGAYGQAAPGQPFGAGRAGAYGQPNAYGQMGAFGQAPFGAAAWQPAVGYGGYPGGPWGAGTPATGTTDTMTAGAGYQNAVPQGWARQGAAAPGDALAVDGATQAAMQAGALPITGANSPATVAPSAGLAQTMPVAPHVSERGELALRHIAQNGKGGPTDLTRSFGYSDATWSRELDALAGTGLIYKRGQKYVLTEMGRNWSQAQPA